VPGCEYQATAALGHLRTASAAPRQARHARCSLSRRFVRSAARPAGSSLKPASAMSSAVVG
jgi:hypothetical protein